MCSLVWDCHPRQVQGLSIYFAVDRYDEQLAESGHVDVAQRQNPFIKVLACAGIVVVVRQYALSASWRCAGYDCHKKRHGRNSAAQPFGKTNQSILHAATLRSSSERSETAKAKNAL